MRYEPLADRLIIEELAENRRTAGGIVIPDRYVSQKHVAFGTVLAVGAGRVNAEGKTIPLSCKPGDTIAYPRQAPAQIPIFDDAGNEKIVLLLRESDAIAIVHDMPRPSSIVDTRGAPLSLVPQSIGKADSCYESEEQLVIAERAGWTVDDIPHIDQES